MDTTSAHRCSMRVVARSLALILYIVINQNCRMPIGPVVAFAILPTWAVSGRCSKTQPTFIVSEKQL